MGSTDKAGFEEVYDVVIVGAGISGINASYRVQTELPGSKYVVLESRGGIGGTWDFFKYPGLRSDSDLHTFGFPWRPWTEQKAIADGATIRDYIVKTAASEGIDKHILYHHKLVSGNWSSETQTWALTVAVNGKERIFNTKFVILGTGYYNYEEALPATIPGIENFKGTIIHPQFWPEDLDYTDKRMVVIGSGATAVTLLPSLAKKAEHVTMLQRSPGYLISRPSSDPMDVFFRKFVPDWIRAPFIRAKFLVLPFLFFQFCRAFPTLAKRALKRRVVGQLPKNVPHDPHFEPNYNPWEQRLCMCPDGDFFEALRSGKTDIATGHIDTMTNDTVILKSGQKLKCDILVTATGLKISLGGGAKISVDNEPVNVSEKFLWKGQMVSDIPNVAFVIGYTNASWTLGADATAISITRLIKTMKAQGQAVAIPRIEHPEKMTTAPLLNLNSTYVKRAVNDMPKTGNSGPWVPRTNFFVDNYSARYGNITDSLEFIKPVSA